MEISSDHSLDLRGEVSPLTLLKVIREFREMKVRETLELLGSDPETRTNLLKVLPASSYHVMSEEEFTGDTPCFRIRIRKEIDTAKCRPKHSEMRLQESSECRLREEAPCS